MTVEEAVEAGALAFASAESAAQDIKYAFRDLKEVFEVIRDGAYIGGIECMALAAEADALATIFYADLTALHLRLTNRAKELGIDLPSIESGGR